MAKRQAPSLASLCLRVVEKHLEDIIPHLTHIVVNFLPHIKQELLTNVEAFVKMATSGESGDMPRSS
ncbi:unnamed protein product, partial [Dovyalis caffra]